MSLYDIAVQKLGFPKIELFVKVGLRVSLNAIAIVFIYIACLCVGGQRWRKHRQLPFLSKTLYDPLAQRRHLQRHHC